MREHVVTTDAEGRARTKLDARGPWLVHGADLRRADSVEFGWETDFTALVIEAR
jgi:hypothetical protein